MVDSDYIFESGDPIHVGSHGDHDYMFASGDAVTNGGDSPLVFQTGVGLGGGNIIDNFESGDFSAYDTSNDGGYFSIVQSPVQEGSYALAIDLNYSDINSYWVRSTSGLPAYPSKGDTFSFWYRPEGVAGDKTKFRWNAINSSTYYVLWLNQSNGGPNYEKVTLGRNETTNLIDPGNGTWDATANEWFEIEVQWGTDDTFTLTVYDVNGNAVQGPHSATDGSPLSEYDAIEWHYGVAGANGSDTNYVYFDNARIKS